MSDFDPNDFSSNRTKSGSDKYIDSSCQAVVSSDSPRVESVPSNYKMWAASSDNDYVPCEHAVKELPPGQYLINISERKGLYFSRKTVNLDSLLVLPDSNSDKVLKSIANFWTRESKFREHGFLWKRGIMLYGPPGSGKTSTVQQISKLIVDSGGISVYSTVPHIDAEGLRLMRNIEPRRPIVVMIEDIDAVINRHGEAALLAMLDGELQIDNVVFIATTNYPELLDKRFVNRPSRFDEIIKIGMPSAVARQVYIEKKNPNLSAREVAEWVDSTTGFSIAHLRELIVAVECLGNAFVDAVERLRKMNDIPVSSKDADERKFGFGG